MALSKSRLVAATTRTSVLRTLEEPTRRYSPVSEHPEQPRLGGHRELAHLIEKDGAAVGLLEVALARLVGAGEAALLVAEELGIDGALRDGPAVHGDVRAVLPRAVVVDDLGQGLLSRARLPADQHRDVGRSHAHRRGEGALQTGAAAHDAEPGFDGLQVHAMNPSCWATASSTSSPRRVMDVWSVVRT